MCYGSQMNPNERNPIRVRWSVKGVHQTRITPPRDAILNVHREADNPYDPYAMRVTIPQITDIPEEARHWQCRYQNGVRAMRDLAGETVGHVPANLCKALSILKGSRLITGDIKATITGEAHPSQQPPVQQRFQRGAAPQGRDVPGGGVEIPCTYNFTIELRNLRLVTNIIRYHVPAEELHRFCI